MVPLPVTLFMSSALLSSCAVVLAMSTPMYEVDSFEVGSLKVKGPVDLFIPDSKEKTISLTMAAAVMVITLSMLVNFVDKAISRVSHLVTAAICMVLACISILMLDKVVAMPAAETIKGFIPESVVEHTDTYAVTYTLLASSAALLAIGAFRK